MKYIIGIDIGGTTFNTGLFSQSLNEIDVSNKFKIRHYDGRDEVVEAIFEQINEILSKNKVREADVLGVGIAVPGPLDSKKGKILNTPNLQMFQNYDIAKIFSKKLHFDTFIENDANLFALGEWYSQYRNSHVLLGITLGTGLGSGLILNGNIFTGGNGMAMEFGLSPFEWGRCEKNVCIGFIRNRAKELYGEEISPVIIEKYFMQNDKKAIKIYHEFGHNLGIVLSHLINVVDPQIITLGGGLSKAFKCFSKKMFLTIKKHSPSYNFNQIIISQSTLRERSTMVGASMMVKENKKNK